MDFISKQEWESSQQLQIFYSRSFLYYKKFRFVSVRNLSNPRSLLNLNLQPFSMPFLSFSRDPTNQYVVFQQNRQLTLYELSTSHYVSLKLSKKTILGYDWIENSPFTDFFLVSDQGVQFFKIKSGSLQLVKNHKRKSGHYWYQQNSGYLLISGLPPHQGEIWVFQCKQTKSPKSFRFSEFQIDTSPCITNDWTPNNPMNRNLLSLQGNGIQNDHRVLVAQMYQECYFIHLDCFKGYLTAFSLDSGQKFQIGVKPGIYQIKVVRDLLVLQSFSLQESSLYDFKSENCSLVPFAIIKHGESLSNGFRYDASMYTNCNFLESEQLLYPSFVSVASNLYYDTNGNFQELEIIPEKLVENHPYLTEAILFLQRRIGC